MTLLNNAEDQLRERFEGFISVKPYFLTIERFPEWPGKYKSRRVQPSGYGRRSLHH